MIYPLRAILLLPLTLSAFSTNAQVDGRLFRTDASYLSTIKVTENNIQKPLAWAGGWNLPQFAMVDLGHDGKNDLVVYENSDVLYGTLPISNNTKTFINVGGSRYKYAPEYEYLIPFPYRMMKMLDYNCDQVPDFLYGDSFLNICDGYYNSDNNWACKNCRVIYEKGINPAPVPFGPVDIPGIANIDNDNDIDFVTLSGNKFYHYKDMRHEESLPCDTIRLKLKDACWGKVHHIEKRAYELGISCDNTGLKMSNDEAKTTGGSVSTCLFDADGDGDFDALIGDSKFSDIQYLKNGRVEYGYPIDTIIAQDTNWQAGGHKLHMAAHPMAYWLDIDNDNDNDIIIAPQAGENYRSVAYYRNMGSQAAPSFVYQKDSFLIEEIVDAGSNSYPFLYDYNKDGKKDLFIGSRGYYQPGGTYKSALLYLENTSTSTDVSFSLVTRNFLNIGSYSEQGAAIAIGDLDNDGRDDLVAGRLDGSIICFKNHAAASSSQPDWQLFQARMKTTDGIEIYMGNYAAPCIYDIDGDGKNDLIVGNATGYLTYYKNIGLQGQIGFEYKTNKLGGVKVLPDEPQGYSAPYIGPIDNSGAHYLMVGSGTGAIYRYTGFQNGNVITPYTLIDTMYSDIKIPGQFSSVSFGDILGDNKHELFIGNSKGGLFAYRQIWDVHVDEVKPNAGKLEMFPNPAKDKARIMAAADFDVSSRICLFDNMGRSYKVPFAVNGKAVDVDVSSLPPGIYIFRINSGKDEFKAVFIKQ